MYIQEVTMADNTETREQVSGKYLRYMNRPLVREGNTICYGDMSDKCFLILEIMSANPSKIVKQGEKSGLSAALNMGMIWLDRANKSA